ncbi:hypothetical protein [Priestia megaterium]|uniref:hypothetical protein n=1 Tax=Priestia megaterium TaxID=1404 RepID=UPI000F285127|nr:hypothetical protein [Priestia megaterium]RMA90221.1 uncharacterized protein DUF1173 [Priestia megaterium]
MSATRSFAIYNKKTGELLRRKAYDLCNEDFLNYLKDKIKREEVIVYCCCSNRIEMKVSKRPHLYPANHKTSHSENCIRNPKYKGTNDYEKAWKFDEQKGEYVVRVENIVPFSKIKDARESMIEGEEKRNKIYIEREGSKKRGEATIFGLATRLNMMAWERIVLGKKKKLPENVFELARHVYSVSNKVRLSNKKKPLSDMFHKQLNIRDVNVEKDVFFVYMYYNDKKQGYNDQLFNGTVKDIVHCHNAFEKENGFYVDINEFNGKLASEPHSDMYVIAGFVYKAFKYDKKLTLGNYCLIPVSKAGLFVESSYEKEVYDALYVQDRRFYKPYLPTIVEYEDFVPDFIIEEENKKPTIGEIFGIKNDEEYEKRRSEKLSLSRKNDFRNLYDFWKWDVNKGEKLILPN